MLTAERKAEIEKLCEHDRLTHNIKALQHLGFRLKQAEKTISIHSDDWDQGFMEAKHMIGEWIIRLCNQA